MTNLMKRQYAPATSRNKVFILEVLRDVLPKDGYVLEIASGTGEHAHYFSSMLPSLHWQPSDCNPQSLESIRAWSEFYCLQTVDPPLEIDVTNHPWPLESCDAIVCINMIHISPWSSCKALFQGAKRLLPSNGVIYLYGPFQMNGDHTSPSNESFDRSLRMRDPDWGVRHLEDVMLEARSHGFELEKRILMPANNFSVLFRKDV